MCTLQCGTTINAVCFVRWARTDKWKSTVLSKSSSPGGFYIEHKTDFVQNEVASNMLVSGLEIFKRWGNRNYHTGCRTYNNCIVIWRNWIFGHKFGKQQQLASETNWHRAASRRMLSKLLDNHTNRQHARHFRRISDGYLIAKWFESWSAQVRSGWVGRERFAHAMRWKAHWQLSRAITEWMQHLFMSRDTRAKLAISEGHKTTFSLSEALRRWWNLAALRRHALQTNEHRAYFIARFHMKRCFDQILVFQHFRSTREVCNPADKFFVANICTLEP